MPVHDWTKVEAGIFHDFHHAWVGQIRTALNEGLLPEGYYALAEQHMGALIPDVLALHASPAPAPSEPRSGPPMTGGTLLAEAPPKVQRRQRIVPDWAGLRRSIAIRHVSGHRLVALVEIVSPANKDRPGSVEMFVEKAASALKFDVNLLVVDLFPPGPHDPSGIHAALVESLSPVGEPYELPPAKPLTLASYVAGPHIEMYLEHVAVGERLSDMPLFLRHDRYVSAPLEATYERAWRGMPAFWRDVLDGRSSASG
jgi:hypothetical protein